MTDKGKNTIIPFTHLLGCLPGVVPAIINTQIDTYVNQKLMFCIY